MNDKARHDGRASIGLGCAPRVRLESGSALLAELPRMHRTAN